MQVIFIKDLKNQGKKGEIKEVKDGYAKNFLINKGYAVQKNKENTRKLELEKKKEMKEDLQNREEAEKTKKALEKEKYQFKVKTGEHDKVFGSVSVKQIKEQLDKKYKINKNDIIIANPIASLGFHEVEIILYKDIKAKIKIEVIKEK